MSAVVRHARELIAALAAAGAVLLPASAPARADPFSCGDQCNGNVPSYDNPNCWPGAVYCPPAGAPEDTTVTFWDGSQWVSGASGSYGQPCSLPDSP
jgi:hypothetical protein